MTSDQFILLQKAKDNIRASKLLLEEKLCDVLVSRAYYAMFYIAEAFLLGEVLLSLNIQRLLLLSESISLRLESCLKNSTVT